MKLTIGMILLIIMLIGMFAFLIWQDFFMKKNKKPVGIILKEFKED